METCHMCKWWGLVPEHRGSCWDHLDRSLSDEAAAKEVRDRIGKPTGKPKRRRAGGDSDNSFVDLLKLAVAMSGGGYRGQNG